MMTKKNYNKAAKMVQDLYMTDVFAIRHQDGETVYDCRAPIAVENAFVLFFQSDNPNFDEDRFRKACKPERK